MKKLSLGITLIVVMLFAIATMSMAQTKTINGCVNNKNGALRIVSDASKCTKSETHIWWNQVGQEVFDVICQIAVSSNISPCPSFCECPPTPSPKIVFLSSAVYNGNLGGLEGADNKCTALANASGLSGLYKAWLSDQTGSPSSRFTHNAAAYKRVDGVLVANDWNNLIDGSLLNPIDVYENGAVISGPESVVWTATLSNGQLGGGGGVCSGGAPTGWLTDSNQDDALVGDATLVDSYWTDAKLILSCDFVAHIYCFEQ
jgi:hypothetical protein